MSARDDTFLAFARRMTFRRLAALDRQLVRARGDLGPETVHDLRVAARRLQYTLDSFRELLEGGKVRQLRKRVKRLLSAGGSVRDRDVALELAGDYGLAATSPVAKSLLRQREKAADKLKKQIHRPRYVEFAVRWADQLWLTDA